jgi:arginyl-tRNA synthetase
MNGKDGKPFKTREGGVMRLEHLIKSVADEVYRKIMENRNMEEEEARKVAALVGLAALKYGDLSNQISKDYIFDVDRFTSFEGDTGPYILYTVVRIKSILAKYQETKGEAVPSAILPAYSESEKAFALELTKFNEMIYARRGELHLTVSVLISMIWPMLSTAFIMTQKSLPRKMRRNRLPGLH